MMLAGTHRVFRRQPPQGALAMTSPRLNPLEQLLRLKSSSLDFNDQVSNILEGAEYKEWAKLMNGPDVVELVNFLDRALDALDPTGSGFRRCMRVLRKTCGERMTLPTSYTFPSQVLAIGNRPVASGGSGDVYEGTLNGCKACVKQVRVYSKDGPDKATKTLYKEAVMWKRLEHKNIVPLLGITTSPLQLISEWIPGGTLTEYIGNNPNADLLGLVCDTAEGLSYLHHRNIIHGDLKGPNILVDHTGQARITDFGLATVTQNLESIRTASGEQGYTARWTAPEILNEEGTYSKEADVFSFAMVMIEVYTGVAPFHQSNATAVVLAIMKGTRPPRPTHPRFTSDLWRLMQHCWDQNPHSRPEVPSILNDLGIAKPPPTNFYFNKIGTSSTLTIGQRAMFAGLPRASAQRSPSPHNTISTISRPMPQISSQWSDHNSPASSVDHVGGLEMQGSQRAGSNGTPQTTSQAPLPGADYPRSAEQRGKPNGAVNRIQSRQDTEASEASPVLADPGAPDPNEQGQVVQLDGRTGGVGNSRTILRDTPGTRNAPERDVGGQGSGVDPNHINLDDKDEGKYLSEGRRDNRSTSRSTLKLGDRSNGGGASINSSRAYLDLVLSTRRLIASLLGTDLPKNASRDHFARSETNPHNMSKSTSRLELASTGGGPLSRQPSKNKNEPSRTNGHANGNASR
ncbi:kinase-like domain-containing protein [Thelephora terrestris]|uniref:Kinase-like domain-containing protein n=1 Tax=Thelephora terrestris TaxID=56493 RepID=A0A9P6HLA6_9AGAM|nr:kinase-like domain-containing protein [Thelephora terrestris]